MMQEKISLFTIRTSFPFGGSLHVRCELDIFLDILIRDTPHDRMVAMVYG